MRDIFHGAVLTPGKSFSAEKSGKRLKNTFPPNQTQFNDFCGKNQVKNCSNSGGWAAGKGCKLGFQHLTYGMNTYYIIPEARGYGGTGT